jgi:hypothetical protein
MAAALAGAYRAAVASPSSSPESVKLRTSTASATVSVHEPIRLIACPPINRRKFGTASAARPELRVVAGMDFNARHSPGHTSASPA